MSFLYKLSKSLLISSNFCTNRKILVLESDDWGSIRMPSKKVYEKCLRHGYPVDLNPFERYDTLESGEDLEFLFEVLSSYKDKNGNHPVITANCVVANPDFNKIRENNFQEYYFELITETFRNYPNHNKNFEIWLKAKSDGLFFPQYHAREHVNVSKLMKALQNNDKDVHFGFANQMAGSIKKGRVKNGNSYVEATNYSDENDKADKLNIYLDGLDVFKTLFKYPSKSIIPTNYTWSTDFNKPVSDKGVKYIQGVRKMKEPNEKNPIYYNRYTGKKNEYQQIDLVRNCDFEPFVTKNIDVISTCLNEIKVAFLLKRPAIISSHRVNFVSGICKSNRDSTLKSLNEIIKTSLAKWPDIEFMTSVQLGDLINESTKYP